MLYVTTRNDADAFTAPRTLLADTAADGGYYIPFHLPAFTADELAIMQANSFSQNVTDILNLFFNTNLECGIVDFCIGRNMIRFVPVNFRMIIMETFHNSEGSYNLIQNELSKKLNPANAPTLWQKIAIRTSVMIAMFCQMLENGVISADQPVDIAVNANDSAEVLAAWYARKMGMPIATIICGCTDNDSLWNLIHRGQVATRNLSLQDQQGIEQLLYVTLGSAAVSRYCRCCEAGQVYSMDEEQLRMVSAGLFASVLSADRLDAVIANFYSTSHYLLHKHNASAYGGLQDYRAKTGIGRHAVLFADFATK